MYPPCPLTGTGVRGSFTCITTSETEGKCGKQGMKIGSPGQTRLDQAVDKARPDSKTAQGNKTHHIDRPGEEKSSRAEDISI